MKHRIVLFLTLSLAVLSCTQNNGYIGHLFGKWQLTEMWSGGEVERRDNIFYNFQSSVIGIQRIQHQDHVSSIYFGAYTREGDRLVIKLLEGVDKELPNGGVPQYLRLTYPDENVFHVEKLTSHEMILTRGADERFVFRKY